MMLLFHLILKIIILLLILFRQNEHIPGDQPSIYLTFDFFIASNLIIFTLQNLITRILILDNHLTLK